MKRRIGNAGQTGLGGGGVALMDGKSTGNTERDQLINLCAEDCYETFFKGTEMDEDYCDAQADDCSVMVGIEPSYMYERLKMITIHEEIGLSNIVTGYAWGAWGTDVRQSSRLYESYKNQSKFVRFVDKWHGKLFELNKQSNVKK